MAAEEKKAETKKAAKERRPQAKKRDLQNERRRLRNKAAKTSIRTTVRQFEEALTKEDSNASKESLNQVYSIVDKGVKRGIIKKNKASRIKSRLTARLKPASS
jgi:small subunit ribosomal protein S20